MWSQWRSRVMRIGGGRGGRGRRRDTHVEKVAKVEEEVKEQK